MDELEINRREAVAGLGLLSLLATMLVVTIFYRIINPSPPAKASLEGYTIAAEPTAADSPLANPLPARAAEAPMARDGEVGLAAFEENLSAPGDAPMSQETLVTPADR